MATMITIEVRGQMITWPEDFAAIMITYYRKHGVPFLVHGIRHERSPKEHMNSSV